MHSIGAGGGSVAWMDDGGLLRVGPHSAGADPGPACYDRGGTRPTVTDAALACGYLDAAYFLGGRLRLDGEAARAAIGREVADPLGLSVEDAARAILAVADEAMVDAIREITVNQGVDPRECLLVAGGGAGGFNAATVARELGCRAALVPRAAATLSAVGAQFSNLVADFSLSAVMSTAAFDAARAESTLVQLDRRLTAFAAELPTQDSPEAMVERIFAVEARYPDQVWDLRVPVPFDDGHLAPEAVDEIVTRFHDLHRRTFAVSDDASPVECQQWTGSVTVHLPKPSLVVRLGGEESAEASLRDVWFDGRCVQTRIVPGGHLKPGDLVVGPAIVEEVTTTIVLPPMSSAEVTSVGSYLITLQEGETIV